MLVLSFCFNTLVVTYFNIYRAIRAALLDLSGTAVTSAHSNYLVSEFNSIYYKIQLHRNLNGLAGGEYVTDKKLLAELNSDKSLSGQKVPEGDLSEEAMSLQEVDHCAPDLTKTERLRRLALKGTVRETGYQTYSTGNYEIVFSADNLYRCK